MDGTLLDENGVLNDEFFDILPKLKEKGVTFAVASGRQYYNLLEKFNKVKDEILYIAENGTYVVHKGKELYSNFLSLDIVHELIDLGRAITNCELVLCGKNSAYIECSSESFVKEVKKYYHRYEIVEDLKMVKDEILKFTICDFLGAAENSNKHFSLYRDKLQVTVSGSIWLDIVNQGVNKGIAISKLQSLLNISPKETMVFGDYYNDLEMLQSAYHSYAMENAHDDIKKHARFIAKSNKDNGVIETIKENFQLK